MNKDERISDFVHKLSIKEHMPYDKALELAITQEFIKYVENDREDNYIWQKQD